MNRLYPHSVSLCPRVLAAAILGLAVTSASGCKSSVRQPHGGSRGGQGQAAQPLLVVAIDPPAGRTEVGPDSVLEVSFSEAVDLDSLGQSPVRAVDLKMLEPIPGSVAVGPGGRSLIFRPEGGIPDGAMFSFDLSRDLRSSSGGPLAVSSDPGAPRLPAFYATFSEAPRIQGSLRFVEATSSSISLEWDRATDNSSPDGSLLTYLIFAATASEAIDYSKPPLLRSDPGATSAAVTRLEPGVEYRMACRARDELGNLSPPTNDVVARTRTTDDALPPDFGGVTGLEADPEIPSRLKVTWAPGLDRPDPQTPLTYNVYLAFGSGEQDFTTPSRTSAAGATELLLEGLAPNTEHFVVVRAMDASGNEEKNTVEAVRRTPVSYVENVFKILNLPRGYDASLCWPPCTNFVQPGGCARGGCHTDAGRAGGLGLQTYAQMIQSDTIVAGNPARSQFIFLLRTTTARRMPRGGTCNLGEDCIQTLERWIAEGARNN